MNKPLVSIITSYYNGEKYLVKFLENISKQSFIDNIELVFVGCLLSDTEKTILNKYSSKINIKQILLDELKTQSECWNIAIQNSDTDFICIQNVDDLRTKNSIKNQYNIIANNNNTSCVFGMFVISNVFGNEYGKLIDHSKYTKKDYSELFLLGPFFMFRKNLINNIGYFDEQFKSGSDYDFALRIEHYNKNNNCYTQIINSIDGYFLDVQQGLSTKGNLQPIERTVIELRYNLLHKIDNNFLPFIKKYNLDEIINFGCKISLTNVIKEYKIHNI